MRHVTHIWLHWEFHSAGEFNELASATEPSSMLRLRATLLALFVATVFFGKNPGSATVVLYRNTSPAPASTYVIHAPTATPT
jgi:hypothetical protein